MRLLDRKPNWNAEVRSTTEFKTDSLASRSSREQRQGRRAEPRRMVDFSVLLDGDDYRDVQRFLMRWQNELVVIGDPVRKMTIAAQFDSGEDTITVPESAPWFAAGLSVVLEAAGEQSLFTIDSFDAETLALTFEEAAAETLPAGFYIRPALVGRLTASMKMKALTPTVTTMPVSIDIDPGSEPAESSEPQIHIHAGREVLAKRPNWQTALDLEFMWPVEILDFDQGRVEHRTPVAFPTFSRKVAYLAINPGEAVALDEFFRRQCGKLGEFFMSSFMADMVPVADIEDADTTLLVEGRTIYDDFADDAVLRHIAITLRDGRRIYREVASVALDGSNSLLTLVTPFLFDIPLATIAMVSWLTVSRFGSDQMTLTWQTPHVAQCTLSAVSLESLEAEDPIEAYDGAGQYLFEAWGEDGAQYFDPFGTLINTTYPGIFA